MTGACHRSLRLDPLRLPRAGSALRHVYDQLAAGLLIQTAREGGTRTNEVLRDNYNCELRTTQGSGGGTRLLGRWCGDVFVPVERLGHGVAS